MPPPTTDFPLALDSPLALLGLLQLASSALPVGAYSYSEGLEVLVDRRQVNDGSSLEHWLRQELSYGAIRVEAAVMQRAIAAANQANWPRLHYWNAWLSAFRDGEELRQQSWQMGRSLLRLLQTLEPDWIDAVGWDGQDEWNFAIAFGIAASCWQVGAQAATLGYLQSWATNLVNAGIKLIPLGQTTGQQLLCRLRPVLIQTTDSITGLQDDDLASCGWGLSLASMAHETHYSRLFRS